MLNLLQQAVLHFSHVLIDSGTYSDVAELIRLKHISVGQVHVSGHMDKEELVEMVNYIQPKRTFAVHTENQKLFKSHCSNMQIIELGKERARP